MTDAIAHVLPRLRQARTRAFAWRCALPVTGKLALAFGMACLTALAAQVRIPLQPVPFTGQVFAVLLAGVLCGRLYGGLSQALYVGLGVAGVPWFAGLSGGLGAIAGPTGGYLIGFILAAEMIGYVSERSVRARSFLPMFGLMLAGVIVIHLFGLLQLSIWLGGHLKQAFVAGTLPFVFVDPAKALLAASIGSVLLPKDAEDRPDAG